MTTELHIIDMLAKQIADLPVPMHNAVLSYVMLIKETSRSNGQDGDGSAPTPSTRPPVFLQCQELEFQSS